MGDVDGDGSVAHDMDSRDWCHRNRADDSKKGHGNTMPAGTVSFVMDTRSWSWNVANITGTRKECWT